MAEWLQLLSAVKSIQDRTDLAKVVDQHAEVINQQRQTIGTLPAMVEQQSRTTGLMQRQFNAQLKTHSLSFGLLIGLVVFVCIVSTCYVLKLERRLKVLESR